MIQSLYLFIIRGLLLGNKRLVVLRFGRLKLRRALAKKETKTDEALYIKHAAKGPSKQSRQGCCQWVNKNTLLLLLTRGAAQKGRQNLNYVVKSFNNKKMTMADPGGRKMQ